MKTFILCPLYTPGNEVQSLDESRLKPMKYKKPYSAKPTLPKYLVINTTSPSFPAALGSRFPYPFGSQNFGVDSS